MNTQPQRTINTTALIAALIVGGSIVTVLTAAIAGEQLGEVVKAIGAIGVTFVLALGVVAWIVRLAADPVVKIEATRLERQREANRHIEKMTGLGLENPKWGYKMLELPEPEPDMPVSTQGITQEQLIEFKPLAYELLALSIKEMGADSPQIVPAKRARETDYFRDVAVWSNAVRFLLINNIAEERYKDGKSGRRKIGTFLFRDQGTVKQAFERMRQRM